MLTTVFIGGAIVTGVAVAVKMIRGMEDTLESYQKLVRIEHEVETMNDKVSFQG